MNILIPPEFCRLVERMVASGKYTTPDAVVCEALLILERRNQERARLDAELQIGLDQADRGELIELTAADIKAAGRAGQLALAK